MVQNRRFMRFCLIQSFMLAGLFAYIGSSSFVLQKEFGFSPMQFSLVFGLNGIGLIIASWIFSRLARRINAMTLLRGGLIVGNFVCIAHGLMRMDTIAHSGTGGIIFHHRIL